jgi:hypothetical protein
MSLRDYLNEGKVKEFAEHFEKLVKSLKGAKTSQEVDDAVDAYAKKNPKDVNAGGVKFLKQELCKHYKISK